MNLKFNNSFASQHSTFFSKDKPTPALFPYLASLNLEVVAWLDTSVEQGRRNYFANLFSGIELLPGKDPDEMLNFRSAIWHYVV